MEAEHLQLTPAQDPGLLADRLASRLGAARDQVRLAWAPYRVCPLGAHVDHQEGEVTGMALDRGLVLAFLPAEEPRVRMASGDLPGSVEFALGAIPPRVEGDWGNLPRGAAAALARRHELRRGVDAVVQGGLPFGGVSSSAALGVACLLALESANGLEVPPEENIELDRIVENEYLGLDNGILDQSVILLGRPGRLTHVDCRTRRWSHVRLPVRAPGLDIALAHSGITTALTGTGYNRHVAECREAAAWLLRRAGATPPSRPVLRDVDPAVFEAEGAGLPERLRRRARHFFTEQRRVREGLELWRQGDLEGFGGLVTHSGLSSIHDYGCGSPELVALFEALCECPGVYGARFSGAGFRGCCMALIDPERRESVAAEVEARYLERFPERRGGFGFFVCGSGPGACAL